ncbi:MAG: signal peptidase I [Myxococcales bacterium]|nr:signal peptidase I [Myxococcales bacterium]MCB9668764.1 signal peptidase I [Alphaproteobacteria bacterium]
MAETGIEEEEGPGTVLGRISEGIRSWGPAIFAVLFIRTFVFEPFRIPSGSMVPTLLVGDHVAVTKFSYGIWVPLTLVDIPFLDMAWVVPRYELLKLSDPQRGDIIVFRYPQDESTNYIKRIVGLPGDKLMVRDNQIFVNGVAQPREYTEKYDFVNAACRATKTRRYVEDLGGMKHDILTASGMGGPLADMPEIEIPAERYFVMGDNRDFSEDSRRWRFVRPDQIKGKAHLVWLSWDGCSGGTGGIRMDRFFQNLYAPAQ